MLHRYLARTIQPESDVPKTKHAFKRGFPRRAASAASERTPMWLLLRAFKASDGPAGWVGALAGRKLLFAFALALRWLLCLLTEALRIGDRL